MTETQKKCPKCDSILIKGYIFSNSHNLKSRNRGMSNNSFWANLSPEKSDEIPVAAFKCSNCSFIEFHSEQTTQSKSITDKNNLEKKKFEIYYKLAYLRLRDFSTAKVKLQTEANKLRRVATVFRLIVITLGSIVAIRGIIDQLMVNYQSTPNIRLFIDVFFTLTGVIIAASATLQEAFKFEQRAAGVMELANRAQGHSRVYMASIDNPECTAKQMWAIVEEQNKALNDLYSDAVKQDINLTSDTDVEYGQLLTQVDH